MLGKTALQKTKQDCSELLSLLHYDYRQKTDKKGMRRMSKGYSVAAGGKRLLRQLYAFRHIYLLMLPAFIYIAIFCPKTSSFYFTAYRNFDFHFK